jgi:hypothetical protein
MKIMLFSLLTLNALCMTSGVDWNLAAAMVRQPLERGDNEFRPWQLNQCKCQTFRSVNFIIIISKKGCIHIG